MTLQEENTTENIVNLLNTKNETLLTALQNVFITFKPENADSFDNLLVKLLQLIENLFKNPYSDSLLTEMSCRVYYQILYRAQESFKENSTDLSRQDVHLLPKLGNFSIDVQPFILHGLLLTDIYRQHSYEFLAEKCLAALKKSIQQNSRGITQSLRALILLCKNFPEDSINLQIDLEIFYFAMQFNANGAREDTLRLSEIVHKRNQKYLEEKFLFITSYWPWTNKNKFFLLSSLAGNVNLRDLEKRSRGFSVKSFLCGLRLSLSYKSLYSAGHTLLKSLCRRNLNEIHDLVIEIIIEGSNEEVRNLCNQWMQNIPERNELFDKITTQGILQNFQNSVEHVERYAIISCIFQKEIAKAGKFDENFRILIKNEIENSQINLQIFKYAVDNLVPNSDNWPNILCYLTGFLKKHLNVPCAMFRHNILGKFPQITDFLAKIYSKGSKTNSEQNSRNILNVKEFFNGLRDILDIGLAQDAYQPMLFSLKIYHILHKLLAASNLNGVCKNSNILLNQKLLRFLEDEGIFTFHEYEERIFDLLSNCHEYDDIRELIISIVLSSNGRNDEKLFEKSLEKLNFCTSSQDIDTSAYGYSYARISLHFGMKLNNDNYMLLFYGKTFKRIENILEKENFQNDPFSCCMKGDHLYGHVNCMNELFSVSNILQSPEKISQAISLSSRILKILLKLLNCSADIDCDEAPSFQVMEESLEQLVRNTDWKFIKIEEGNHNDENRKFLLHSLWFTMKACCELGTTIGIILLKNNRSNENIEDLRNCLKLSTDILRKSRHKGAIESAGVALGKLTKEISSKCQPDSAEYKLLFECFSILFGNVDRLSLTRRGAGYSIQFHHLIKNDNHKERPLFQFAIKTLLNYTQQTRRTVSDSFDENHENFDALILHYLCVLVRDSDLRVSISEYYDDIMMSAILRIEEKEWTVRNAALQLFGALVPKIVGQKQAADSEFIEIWRPNDTTFCEIFIKLPKTSGHILRKCTKLSNSENSLPSTATSILFLEFLSSIEYFRKHSYDNDRQNPIVLQLREIFWQFLYSEYEKVRKLAAQCLARIHEFRVEIFDLTLRILNELFHSKNENFRHGLIQCLINCLHKFQSDSQHIDLNGVSFLKEIENKFFECYKPVALSFFTRVKAIEFFQLAKFNFKDEKIIGFLCSKENLKIDDIENFVNDETKIRFSSYGSSLWLKEMKRIYNF